MTQAQQDPAGDTSGGSDLAAAVARLAEQIDGLARRVNDLDNAMGERIESLDRLTDAKFVNFRTLIDSQAEKVALALDASDKAISKAETSTERRFEAVNEFRALVNDRDRVFMPRSEAEAIVGRATERIQELAERIQEMMPRSETSALAQRNAERIQEIADRLNRLEGGRAGIKENKAGIYAAIAAAVAIIAIVSFLANILTK